MALKKLNMNGSSINNRHIIGLKFSVEQVSIAYPGVSLVDFPQFSLLHCHAILTFLLPSLVLQAVPEKFNNSSNTSLTKMKSRKR
jgi:hypothetical protein